MNSSNINRKTNKQFKKKFSVLINDLDAKEPAKKSKAALDNLRALRNSFMHPENHTHTGAMSKNAIMFGIVILNMLFLPVQLFLDIGAEMNRIRGFQSQFDKDLYVMTNGERRILIKDIKIVGAVPVDGGWQYLLVSSPVLDLTDPKDFTYPVLIILGATVIQFNGLQLSMKNAETGEAILFEGTDHPDNIAKYANYLKIQDSVDKADMLIYQQVNKSEIGKRKHEFWYGQMWKTV